MAHSPPATLGGLTVWDAHLIFNGPSNTNTDDIFATLAVDDSDSPGQHGNVYSVFADNLKDRKSTRLNSSHSQISYAVFCLKKKKKKRYKLTFTSYNVDCDLNI